MGKAFQFPVPTGEKPGWLPSSRKRLLLHGKGILSRIRPQKAFRHIELEPVRLAMGRRGADDGMLVVFLTRNDRRMLPSFLAHYREMGVEGFVCVDDESSDGTREYLLAQPDVDLYASNVRFREANRGRIWRERLMARYGFNRWYVNVDSDEFLVYESHGEESIGEYACRLTGAGISRLPSPMLDLYPVGPLSEAELPEGQQPWKIATHFDGDGYRATTFNTGISIYGGVRSRAFGAPGELIKYPLIYWTRDCSLGRTIHRPRPASRNFGEASGALLHFKIFADVSAMAKRAVDNGQHHDGARLYQKMLDALDRGEFSLPYANSVPYTGVADLIARGFIVPLDDSERSFAHEA